MFVNIFQESCSVQALPTGTELLWKHRKSVGTHLGKTCLCGSQ